MNLDNNIILKSENIEYNNDTLKNQLNRMDKFKNLFNVGNAKMTTNADLTFDNSNNKILINGSSTTSTNILLNSPNSSKDKDGIILAPGTYTATIRKKSGSLSNDKMLFYLRKNNGSNLYDGAPIFTQDIDAGVSDNTTYSSTFTLTEETRLHWIGYFDENQRNFNNLVLEFQIEESPQTTDYVPFAAYVVESGRSSKGIWVKLSDGTLFQRGIVTKNIAITNLSSVSNRYYDDGYTINFPTKFIDDDYFVNIVVASNALTTLDVYSITDYTNDYCKFNLSANHSTTKDNFPFRWSAVGSWK